jgi:predicted secreted Zn-dependent protease
LLKFFFANFPAAWTAYSKLLSRLPVANKKAEPIIKRVFSFYVIGSAAVRLAL